MRFADFYRSMSPEGRQQLAERVGTSVAYLQQIAGGHSRPSAAMAAKISDGTMGAVSRLELLYPDEFGAPMSSA